MDSTSYRLHSHWEPFLDFLDSMLGLGNPDYSTVGEVVGRTSVVASAIDAETVVGSHTEVVDNTQFPYVLVPVEP